MNRGTAIALLIVGVVLLIFGYNAYHSVGSNVSEVMTGAPADKTIWLLSAGIIAALVGGFNLARMK